MYLLSFFEEIITFVEKSSRNSEIRQKKKVFQLVYIYNKNKVKTDAMYEKKILDALYIVFFEKRVVSCTTYNLSFLLI